MVRSVPVHWRKAKVRRPKRVKEGAIPQAKTANRSNAIDAVQLITSLTAARKERAKERARDVAILRMLATTLNRAKNILQA